MESVKKDAKPKRRKRLTRVYRINKIENNKNNNKTKHIKKYKKTDKIALTIGATSVASILLLMVIFGEIYLIDNSNTGELMRNTTINGVDVGGLDISRASEKLITAFSNKAENFSLVLNYQDKKWVLTAEDFEVNTNIHTILEEAYLRGTNSTNDIKRSNINKIIKDGNNASVAFNYVFLGLDQKIEDVLSAIEVEPINSEVLFNSRSGNKFTITDGKTGLKVDRVKLYEEINNQFKTNNIINVDLNLVEVEPEITKEYNKSITNLRSAFSTAVHDNTGGRKSNVKMALSKLDGLKVNPGESVSFNYITGPHTAENGYKIAKIIYNGKFTDGVGGGVCQASTTLYNALLKAGIQIDEVNKHTLPVMYVPLALDAMVSEYISDLRFTNNLNEPIFISAYCDVERAYVDIYGENMEEGVEYKTRSETIKTIPHGADNIMVDTNKEYTDKVLFKGEYYRLTSGKDGCEVKAYLQKYKNGNLIEEKEIRHEIYQPQNGLVVEGAITPPENLTPIKSDVKIKTNV